MQLDAIRRVLIIGAGTMGQQIGWQCAAHGCEVLLYDVAAAVLDDAQRRVADYASQLIAQGLMTAEQREAAQRRISVTTDAQRAAQGRRRRLQARP